MAQQVKPRFIIAQGRHMEAAQNLLRSTFEDPAMPRPLKESERDDFVGQVAAEVRRRRVKKFPRAEDAATAAGVPAPTWYKWESGQNLPLSALPTIAEALGCKPRQLLPA